LAAASDLFARFTRHRYRLSLDSTTGASRWRAVESASERGLPLSELSDGTRMQLLLAARLAFSLHLEGELHPPLFLDEALTASDPERFRAVAESLIELSASGRQIFYLTCNPADVAFWRAIAGRMDVPEPNVVDLGEIRRVARGPVDQARTAPPETASWPRPDGSSPEEYAERLSVPLPEPFAPISALHLYHVLRDDLQLLHSVLSRGRVERVGHWRSLVESGAADALFGAEACSRLEAGIRTADLFFEAWRVGRGRPVTADDLRASGAVSDRFIVRIASLATDLDGDAEALMTALEDKHDERAKGFRVEQREALRAYFEEAGQLDPSLPLPPEALRARVLGGLAEAHGHDEAAAGDLSALGLASVHRLIDTLTFSVERCLPDAAADASVEAQ
jgi:hypothetical protein